MNLHSYVDAKSNADIAPCLSVVMPVYNEEATVIPVLERVLSQRPVQEVIVVDDGSSDGGWQKLEAFARTESRELKLIQQTPKLRAKARH